MKWGGRLKKQGMPALKRGGRMKGIAVLAMLAFSLLVLGCTGAQQNAQPEAPQQPVAPVEESKPVKQPTAPEPAPVEAPKAEEPAVAPAPCSRKSGAEKIECAYMEARNSKDVSLCTSLLDAKDDRFKCITQWCASGARDFKQCEKLSGDDRLGCLNKCNPNPNT